MLKGDNAAIDRSRVSAVKRIEPAFDCDCDRPVPVTVLRGNV
jgi:hypothetical protein